jgi:hypothetical protein
MTDKSEIKSNEHQSSTDSAKAYPTGEDGPMGVSAWIEHGEKYKYLEFATQAAVMKARRDGARKVLYKLQLRIPRRYPKPVKDSPMELSRDGQVFNAVIDKVNAEILAVTPPAEVKESA